MADHRNDPGLDQLRAAAGGAFGAAVVVDGDQLDLAPEHPAGLVQRLDRQLRPRVRFRSPEAAFGPENVLAKPIRASAALDCRRREQTEWPINNTTKRTEHGVRLQSSLVDPLGDPSVPSGVRYYTNRRG